MPLRKIAVRLPFFGNKNGATAKSAKNAAGGAENKKSKATHPHAPVDVFVAWSAAEKKMTLIEGRDASLKFNLKPKDWDVISLSHVYDVKTARPHFANVVGALGRVMRLRKNDFAASKTGEAGTITLTAEPTIAEPMAPPMSDTPTETAPVEATFDGTIISSNSNANKPVFWSPIGLLNMLNAGGAVEQILPTRKARTAEFLARGPGEFGVFASTVPKRVIVDGVHVAFSTDLVTNAVTELGTLKLPEVAMLVKFNMPELNNTRESNDTTSDAGDLQSRGIRKVVINW
jgi:hypothetical protein